MEKVDVLLHDLPENAFQLTAVRFAMPMNPFPHGHVAPSCKEMPWPHLAQHCGGTGIPGLCTHLGSALPSCPVAFGLPQCRGKNYVKTTHVLL